jgi:TonB-dependent receptor
MLSVKSKSKNKFRIHPLCLAVITCTSLQAFAQEATQEATETEDANLVERINVTGIRSSLTKSLATKRFSGNIVDVISSEDIGKFPDQNVAESLQRVPGIQISRSKGEGESVSIRGLDPDLVLVTINGRRAPSSTANSATFSSEQRGRRFQFDQLSSELVSSLEVYKTTQARLEEGGVAGTINIKTPRPFDIGKELSSFRLGSSYSELAEDVGPEFGGLYSNLLTEDFGIMISASYSDKTIRQDFVDQPGYNFIDIDQDLNVLSANQSDIPTGDLAHNDVFIPQSSRLFNFDENRKRLGLSGTAQWQVTNELMIIADAFYTSLKVDEKSNYIEALGRSVSALDEVKVNANDTVLSYTANGGFRTVSQNRDPDVKTTVFGLSSVYQQDFWNFNADISYSKNESKETRDLLLYTRDDSNFTISFLEGAPISIIPGFDVTDASEFGTSGLGLFRRQPLSGIDEELSTKFDFTYMFDDSMTIRTGLKYTQSEKEVDEDLANVLFNANGDLQVDLAQVAQPGGLGVDQLLGSSSANLPRNFAVPDIGAWLAFPGASNLIVPGENPLADFRVEEDITAGYVQLDFEGEIGSLPFTADVGVRIVHTAQTSSGFANITLQLEEGNSGGTGLSGDGFTAVQEDQNYTDVLPSANISFNLREDLKLRFAASKVMSRPDLALISPAISINLSQNIATAGEPGLDPFRATQFDTAIEWYINDTSLLSLGYFYKDIDSFIDFVTKQEVLFGANLDVTRPINGEGVKLQGLEFNYQQTFDFLPAPFDGLGLLFNYTLIDDDAKLINELTGATFGLPGSSENSYNVVGIYEKSGFSARLAYNFRDEFVESVSGNRGNPEFVDSYGQLDLTLSYNFNDNYSLSFDAINLNDEVVEKYSFIQERPFEYAETGRRFVLSLRSTF